MPKPKIAIIAHGCRNGGGLIGTLQLLKALFSEASAEYFLVYSKGYGYETLIEGNNCKSYCYEDSHAPHRRWYFETFRLPKIIREYGPDVVFGPGNIGLVHPPCPQALFIRNAYLYHGPDRYPQIDLRDRVRTWALRRQVKSMLPATQRVFVQTPVVQERFCAYWDYPIENTAIVRFPAPVDIQPQPDCPVPPSLAKLGDGFKVLVMTRYMAHRNPDILLPLCRRYREQFRKANIRFITTIDVNHRGRAARFLRNVQTGGLDDVIVNVGPLSRQQVVQYYTHCDVLWLHTLMETLCLPFLEAMTVGLPILAPDFDFARYVCADAAAYYDPWNLDGLFERLMQIREDDNLRFELTQKGRVEIQNHQKFADSWEQMAKDVLQNLRSIITT